MTAPCVMIMAGGTGGHVFPALSLADWLRQRGFRIVWLGTHRGIEARLVPAAGIEIEWIDIGGLRGKNFSTLIAAPWRLARALWQSLRAIWRHRPVVVVGLGGYVTGPGGVAARLAGKPLVIHEQNAVAGFTNRMLAKLATCVLEGFEGGFAPSVGAIAVGNPVREAFFSLPVPAERFVGRSDAMRVLVIGGSQGAQRLNSLVPSAIAHLKGDVDVIVRHQSGERGFEQTQAAYRDAAVAAEVTAFIDDVAAAYAWADIVICRAGALTVAEVAAAGLAAIFIPLPSAVDDHQTRNAEFLVTRGAALRLAERGLDTTQLVDTLRKLLRDRAALLAMAERARDLARPAATRELGEHCLAAAGATA
ncbi:MAG: hypothetical protein RLZZ33_1944 [Pseudomonadota bacterium]|jgi:UDP-N-acetylglucosamine--N-acetylmuramyl-(pentapeptide) pyrophosphoryl-undecaprenol N-acetylglucosamine transferase